MILNQEETIPSQGRTEKKAFLQSKTGAARPGGGEGGTPLLLLEIWAGAFSDFGEIWAIPFSDFGRFRLHLSPISGKFAAPIVLRFRSSLEQSFLRFRSSLGYSFLPCWRNSGCKILWFWDNLTLISSIFEKFSQNFLLFVVKGIHSSAA